MKNQYFGSGTIIKCWNCEFLKQISKAGICQGGVIQVVVSCKKEVTFMADWDGTPICEELTIEDIHRVGGIK